MHRNTTKGKDDENISDELKWMLRYFEETTDEVAELSKNRRIIDEAVYRAVKECIANGIMVDFLKEYESEVKNMLTKEITFEEFVEIRVEEAVEEAVEETARKEKLQNAKNLKTEGISLDTIARCIGLPLATVEAI